MKKIQFLALFLKIIISRYFFRKSPRSNWNSAGKRSGLVKRQLLILIVILPFLILVWILGLRLSSQKSLSEGVIGVYTPNNLPSFIANLISKPLVLVDETGQPIPGQALGWQVNSSIDKYTFKLRDNFFWHDGSPVRSSDISFDLPDVEVAYPDEKTVVFKLTDSFSPFPTLLTSPIFKGNTLIGVGGYKVSSQELKSGVVTKLVLIPAEESQKKLPTLVIKFYPDEKTAKTAFDLGEVDSLLGVSEEIDIKNHPTIGLVKITNFLKVVSIFFNTKDSLLSDKNMRRALTSAIPKIEEEERAKTSIPPYSWAYNNELKDPLDNFEAAKNYLEKVQSGKEKGVVLTTIPQLSELGEQIVQSWKKLEVPAVLRIESGIPQNFQALLIPQSLPFDPDQYALWHSTQTVTNISKYDTNKRVDKDLEDGRKTGDLEKRKERYLDFQKVLLDDSPAAFLYFPKTQILYRKKIEKRLSPILSLQFSL